MARKDRKSAYQDELSEAKWMVDGVSAGGFELEEILAEYGGGAGGILTEPTEEAPQIPVPESPQPVTERRRKGRKTEEASDEAGIPVEEDEPAEEPADDEEDVPVGDEFPGAEMTSDPEDTPVAELPAEKTPPARELTMEDVVSRTIDEVMEEQAAEAKKRRRRGLFSRKKFREPEEIDELSEEEPEEEIGPEVPLDEVASAARKRLKSQRIRLPFAAIFTVLAIALMVVEEQGIVLPYWTGDLQVQAAVLGGLLALTSILCWDVYRRTVTALIRGRVTCDLLASTVSVVTLLDCAAWVFFPERVPVMPYAAPACTALTAALWGDLYRSRAVFDSSRTASVTNDPLYLVTDTPSGACKRRGRLEGFYTDLMKDEGPVLWQTVLMPLIFVGSLVFAGLASLGKGLDQNFLLCWSGVLTAGCSLSLPLVWTLPWSGLAHQLQKSNCAVAGWSGAAKISRRKAVILGDDDIFPPGSVKINGIKLYGEEMRRAVAYAASLVRESGSGLTRLFDGLLRGESGRYMKLDNFCFYEEGGYSADYRGESLLMGTASFMRKMGIRLPGSLNLRTGIFLAVDRQLIAVFAVKYEPAESVDWAMRMLRRNRIAPVLASRDPNIAPPLLRRKFARNAKMQYPSMSDRLSMSEQDGPGRPRALLLREGLLPYAEVVVGSRRVCRSAREGTAFALLGSIAGTLLTGYLVNLGSFALMEPLTILVFQALWVAPVLLLAAWSGRF